MNKAQESSALRADDSWVGSLYYNKLIFSWIDAAEA